MIEFSIFFNQFAITSSITDSLINPITEESVTMVNTVFLTFYILRYKNKHKFKLSLYPW